MPSKQRFDRSVRRRRGLLFLSRIISFVRVLPRSKYLCPAEMPAEVWDRFTVHHTPTHGSWLNREGLESPEVLMALSGMHDS